MVILSFYSKISLITYYTDANIMKKITYKINIIMQSFTYLGRSIFFYTF